MVEGGEGKAEKEGGVGGGGGQGRNVRFFTATQTATGVGGGGEGETRPWPCSASGGAPTPTGQRAWLSDGLPPPSAKRAKRHAHRSGRHSQAPAAAALFLLPAHTHTGPWHHHRCRQSTSFG